MSVISKCARLGGLGLLVLTAARPTLGDQNELTIRYAPHVVSSVSSKSEHATANCTYCGSKIFYTRTYRWDVYNHKWCETTESVPEVCRKCQAKAKEQAKLDQRSRELDRRIKVEETKASIRSKEARLRRLRLSNERK